MAAKKSQGICALCKKLGQLCESHIIPEFLYEFVFDDKHRYAVSQLADDTGDAPIYDEMITRQTGVWEHLLCSECENRISRWETYASDALALRRGVTCRPDTSAVVLEGINYDDFKLFQMSLLWRMSVSSRAEFSGVTLGRHHSEVIRRRLYAMDPGKRMDYPCLMSIDGSDSRILIPPRKSHLNLKKIFHFITPPYLWFYPLNRRSQDPIFNRNALTEDGALRLPRLDFADYLAGHGRRHRPARRVIVRPREKGASNR